MLIVVTGLPCSGKTTLGRRIAHTRGWPFITKDGFKERLFDTLGWSDRAWSKRLSAASFELLFYALEAVLEAGGSCVIEGNFNPQAHSEPLRRIAAAHGSRTFQVHCVTQPDVLLERFKTRWARGERHAGHADHATLPEMESLVRRHLPPLDLPGPVFELDTSDLERLETAALMAAIEAEWRHA